MKRLLIATTNQAKIAELTQAFQRVSQHGVELVQLHNMLDLMKPKETGKTFEENAKLKAQYYAKKTGLPAVSDDGGLMIDALDGEPGVKSRRWVDEMRDATDQELIDFTVKKMKDVSKEKRTAQLATCLCFYNEDTDTFICEQEAIDGWIAEKPTQQYKKGYPYRALFIVSKFNKYYDELTEEEHAEVNHRLIAAKRLEKKIVEHIQQ